MAPARSAATLDVAAQDSVDAAVQTVLSEHGRLDVLIHNAGHMVTGPAEAFTVDQLTQVYDTNVLGTQRLNRAALPHLRAQRQGLVLTVCPASASARAVRAPNPLDARTSLLRSAYDIGTAHSGRRATAAAGHSELSP